MTGVGALALEAVHVARAYRSSSVTISLIGMLMCLLVFLTAGRTAVTEAQILATIDDAGVRLVTASTMQGAAFDAQVARRLEAASGVDWAVGLGSVRDVRNAAIPDGTAVSARSIHGTVPQDSIRLVAGRWPGPGEVVVPATVLRSLGMTGVAGAVTDGTVVAPVVGIIEPTGPVAPLAEYILAGSWDGPDGAVARSSDPVTVVFVMAATPQEVPTIANAVRLLAGVDEPDHLTVETSDALVTVQDVVSGDFGSLGRHLGISAVAAGAGVVTLTMLQSVTTRRRDFGRRRALGASRTDLVCLVLMQAALPAAIGAAVGTALGLVGVVVLTHASPAADLLLAVPALSVLAALTGAFPAAVLAARRDPVSILRVA